VEYQAEKFVFKTQLFLTVLVAFQSGQHKTDLFNSGIFASSLNLKQGEIIQSKS